MAQNSCQLVETECGLSENGGAKFADWLEEQMRGRDWKPVEFARAAGMQPAVLSRILNQEREASPESCKAIARALRVPVEDVFIARGWLPAREYAEAEGDVRQIVAVVQELPADDRRTILKVAQGLDSLQSPIGATLPDLADAIESLEGANMGDKSKTDIERLEELLLKLPVEILEKTLKKVQEATKRPQRIEPLQS